MVYDYNFGAYEIRDPEDLEFFREVQAQSVEKKCEGCGRKVSILPEHAYCNRCANLIEQRFDLEL